MDGIMLIELNEEDVETTLNLFVTHMHIKG